MKSEKLKKYEADYTDLPFEDVLRTYRQQNIFTQIAATVVPCRCLRQWTILNGW
jgi:hypothetical protein